MEMSGPYATWQSELFLAELSHLQRDVLDVLKQKADDCCQDASKESFKRHQGAWSL